MPRRKTRSRTRWSLWLALALAVLAPVAAGVWALREIDRPGPHADEVRIEVKPGSPLRAA